MHECQNCGQACDCDGDDTWDVMKAEWYYLHCTCPCQDEDEDYEDYDDDYDDEPEMLD